MNFSVDFRGRPIIFILPLEADSRKQEDNATTTICVGLPMQGLAWPLICVLDGRKRERLMSACTNQWPELIAAVSSVYSQRKQKSQMLRACWLFILVFSIPTFARSFMKLVQGTDCFSEKKKSFIRVHTGIFHVPLYLFVLLPPAFPISKPQFLYWSII